MSAQVTVMVSEGAVNNHQWRQYFVITDRRVAIVHMVPALWGGWKFDRVCVQGEEDWPQDRANIVAWKLASHHGPALAPELGEFMPKLLAKAGVTLTGEPAFTIGERGTQESAA